jgi:hypothetical protein
VSWNIIFSGGACLSAISIVPFADRDSDRQQNLALNDRTINPQLSPVRDAMALRSPNRYVDTVPFVELAKLVEDGQGT